MKVIETRDSGATTLDCRHQAGTAKVLSKTITVNTTERLELINLTDEIRALVESSGIQDGYVQLSSLHTTAALFINEWQDALLADVKSVLDRIVPQNTYYRHNDPECSDCDRQNADAHLRAVVLGQSVSVPIAEGKPVLGRWQSVILAELDGPNDRQVFTQVFGI